MPTNVSVLGWRPVSAKELAAGVYDWSVGRDGGDDDVTGEACEATSAVGVPMARAVVGVEAVGAE